MAEVLTLSEDAVRISRRTTERKITAVDDSIRWASGSNRDARPFSVELEREAKKYLAR
jgi:hypothetical protein